MPPLVLENSLPCTLEVVVGVETHLVYPFTRWHLYHLDPRKPVDIKMRIVIDNFVEEAGSAQGERIENQWAVLPSFTPLVCEQKYKAGLIN